MYFSNIFNLSCMVDTWTGLNIGGYMKFLEGLGYIFIFTWIVFIAKVYAVSQGFEGSFPSADATYIVDGLILAGCLASGGKDG